MILNTNNNSVIILYIYMYASVGNVFVALLPPLKINYFKLFDTLRKRNARDAMNAIQIQIIFEARTFAICLVGRL